MDETEMTRLADGIHAFRPDWGAKSLRTFIGNNFADKAFGDCVIAFSAIAGDPSQQTPRALLEHGPWWMATDTARRRGTARIGPAVGAERCGNAGHEHEDALRCRLCAAERAAGDAPSQPADPVAPPPEIVAVAVRHRARSAPVQPTSGRSFAQVEELRTVDASQGGRCSRSGCGAFYLTGPEGAEAHRALYGHHPEADTPTN